MSTKSKPVLGFNIDIGKTETQARANPASQNSKIPFSSRIDAEKYRQLKILAISKNISVQELLETAIDEFLAKNQ